jgi:hypothetical protein
MTTADISQDEYNDALYSINLSPGQARERVTGSADGSIPNRREALRKLGHPKYQHAGPQTLGEWAEFYASNGVPVFPLAPGSKKPLISKKDGGNGFHDATTDLQQVRTRWKQCPTANIGAEIPTDCVVFDVDDGEVKTLGDIGNTAIAESGGEHHKPHVWFKLPAGVTLKASAKYPELPGIDVLAHGHYMVLPPSVVNSQYRWIRPLEHIQPIPAHLLDILNGNSREEQADPIKRAAKWLQQAISRCNREAGDRNNAGFDLAGQLRADQYSDDDAKTVMLAFQREVGPYGDHPYTVEEALKSLAQAYSRDAREQAKKKSAGGFSSDSDSDSHSYSHSSSHSHSHSWTVESMRTLAMEADVVEAEAVCERNDRRCWPGTPLYDRRQAQYAVLEALWGHLFPNEVLPHRQIQTWLKIMEPGNECGDVVDGILAAWENHRTFGNGKDIKTPRKWATDCLLKSADPDHGVKRAALKHREEEPEEEAA